MYLKLPGIHYVTQADLKLVAILLPQPSDVMITSMSHHAWLKQLFFSSDYSYSTHHTDTWLYVQLCVICIAHTFACVHGCTLGNAEMLVQCFLNVCLTIRKALKVIWKV